MSILTRPILEIRLNKLGSNFDMLKKIAAGATPAAVVKDDAYGLSAPVVVDYLFKNCGCKNFFVAHAVEGERIRDKAPGANIMEHQIPGIKPVIHIETGLNRLGFREEELERLSDEDRDAFSLVMSHLACGDEAGHFMNARQLENFNRLKNLYFPHLPASLSASDGVFLGKDFQQNMVRLGAAMYGINTAPYRENQMAEVVKIQAPVLQIEPLSPGDFVGYSATYRANSPRKVAIISIGYGDGIPRSLSNVGKVFFTVHNKISEARMIGRISMDNIICDVTGIDGLEVGDLATLADDFYTLDDMGRDAGTISYEILSRIGKNTRFIRRYLEE